MIKVIDVTSRFIGTVEIQTTMKHPDTGNATPFHIGYFKDYEIPEKFLNRHISTMRIENNMLIIQMIGDAEQNRK